MNLLELQNVLRQAGWPDEVHPGVGVPLIPLFAAIGMAESSGNPGAHNTVGEDSVGLWQINRRAHPGYTVLQLKDPVFNAQVAWQVFQSEGIRAWGAFTNGSYRKFLDSSLASYGGSPVVPDSAEIDILYFDSKPAYGSYDEFLAATQGVFAGENFQQAGMFGSGNLQFLIIGVLGVVLLVTLIDG
jgi:hypothetical protein